MINLGQLLGRVGKIDTRALSNGNKVTNISMVTSKFYKNKEGVKQEKITWHNVSLFSKLAEVAENYVKVGDMIYIQGEMDNQKFTGQDGIERTKSFIIGHEMKMMPKPKEHKNENKTDSSFPDVSFPDDKIPF